MLPHAPGVQMADIPADGVAIKEDVDDADPDKRNPQQVSFTFHLWCGMVCFKLIKYIHQ